VHDRDEIGDLDRSPWPSASLQVGCEGADPAGARREGGDGRRPHRAQLRGRVSTHAGWACILM